MRYCHPASGIIVFARKWRLQAASGSERKTRHLSDTYQVENWPLRMGSSNSDGNRGGNGNDSGNGNKDRDR